jgi:formylglycine-generating enzyme required for sulfatase activity
LRASGGEVVHVAPELPSERDVPDGFVFVPSGRSLFGTNTDDELRRAFFDAAPLHEVRTAAFLIGRTEVTFAQWIEFLRSLPPRERARRAPRVAGKSFTGAVELRELSAGGWELKIQAGAASRRAREGERIEYRARKRLRSHDWRRFPVVGISALDAEAYVAWLGSSGALPGARLCSEAEWERAARGADDREYPHGRRLSPGDANYDATYGKDPQQVGLDEVGSHPASDSPFGVSDLAGNAFEWTTSSLAPNQHVARGGSFFYDFNTARSTNRQVVADSYRDATLGLRVCAAPMLQ